MPDQHSHVLVQPHDLQAMTTSLEALLEQKAALERQIAVAQRSARARAIAQIRELMTAHGLTVADLASSISSSARRVSSTKKPVAPKYRHPVSGQTWSGRGLKPKWLSREIADGRNPEDFKI